ncbi:DUF4406 domain-containing protein [Allomuricauda sp. NBRC 101325]|uniref:DUF7768 domain-containing protein n=1 Tax=Allomuricauda sp. NBRC 101325 TaxID=1113758 RepID=UPI0024A356F5|nr:DUF4406 domain-containing protein [Muricauda sp. NBRC 101325]GLU44736.1 hypothetical protein Musp01_23600 [Muricauda sp. NBRC 101325]
MKKVFIAGPYTKGDVAINVKKAMDIADEIIDLGHAPFCPHLTHFLHMNKAQPYEKWLAIDAEFLKCCDIAIRINGDSNGADKEIELANKIGIPVCYSLNELKEILES